MSKWFNEFTEEDYAKSLIQKFRSGHEALVCRKKLDTYSVIIRLGQMYDADMLFTVINVEISSTGEPRMSFLKAYKGDYEAKVVETASDLIVHLSSSSKSLELSSDAIRLLRTYGFVKINS